MALKRKKLDDHWYNRAELSIAQITGTNSKRPSAYLPSTYPTHVLYGRGPYLYDYKGNKYIDFVGGLGASILGYGNAKVAEAVNRVLMWGPSLSLPTTLEVECAEMIQSIFPFMDRVRFYKTGSEACTAAMRIARTYMGEGTVYSNGYHGWHDEFTSLTEPAFGVVGDYKITDEYNYKHNDISIIEPLRLDIEFDKEFSDKVCSTSNFLIADEIITGLRVPKNSVTAWWDLQPDIVCFGKGIANGFPLSIIGGDASVMECNEWFCSSTYSGEVMSLAACMATLDEVVHKRKVDELWYYANRFMDNFNDMCKPIGVKIEGYGTRGMLDVSHRETQLFMQEACKAGMIWGKCFMYNFSHLESNLDTMVLNIVDDIVSKIALGKVKFEGPGSVETFKR